MLVCKHATLESQIEITESGPEIAHCELYCPTLGNATCKVRANGTPRVLANENSDPQFRSLLV